MDTFNEEREDFERYCKCFTNWDSDYLFSYDIDEKVYRNETIENAFQCWFTAWSYGYDEGHKQGFREGKLADDRIGINDRISPELLTKRINDWA